MFNENFHTHSTYCDGKSTLEESVLSAINLGFKAIGFSGHSYLDFGCDWSMSPEDTLKYIDEISQLKRKYEGKIKIYCGTEMDYFSENIPGKYDYSIGAVHYIRMDGEYLPIDSSLERQQYAADKYFGGSLIDYCVEYYRLMEDVIEKTKGDFVAHFDLVTKFNENDCAFDTNDPKYIEAWKKAADRLLECNVPFEINTGAIARKKRVTPYPSMQIADYINSKGGKFIVTSDCHDASMLSCAFDLVEKEYGRLNIINLSDIL